MLPRFDFGEHRSALAAHAGMSPEPFLLRCGQLLVQSVEQESFELIALHTVMNLTWHHITCL
jgi:hypothetical protein